MIKKPDIKIKKKVGSSACCETFFKKKKADKTWSWIKNTLSSFICYIISLIIDEALLITWLKQQIINLQTKLKIHDTCRSWKTPPVRTSLAGRTSTAVNSPASFSSISRTHNSSRRVTSLHLQRGSGDTRQTSAYVSVHLMTRTRFWKYWWSNQLFH